MAKEEVRIEGVYRRWQSLSLLADKLAASPIERFESLLTGFFSLGLLFVSEISIISKELLPDFSRVSSPYYILPSLLFMPAQGWYVNALLSRKTPADGAIPFWLKMGRCLLGSIPFLSPIIITAWMELIEHRPAMLFSTTRELPLLDLKNPPVKLSKGRLASIFTVLFHVETVLNSVLFYIWVLWLDHTDSLGASRRVILVAFCLVLHVVFLLSFNLKPQASERFTLRPSLLLYLLPLPFPVIVLFKQKNCTTILTGTIRKASYPLLLRTRNELHTSWIQKPWFRQWRRPLGVTSKRSSGGDVEAHLMSFYRQKIALLLLEGNILAQFLSFLSIRLPRISPAIHVALLATTVLGLTFTGIGLGTLAILAFRRLLRVSGSRSPVAASAFYLALAQGTFVGGIQSRLFWNERRFYELIWLMIIGGSLLFVLWLSSMFRPEKGRSAKSTATFFLIFCMIASSHEKVALLSLEVLYLLALLTPLWSLMLFLQFGAWFLRPFSWRDVFDDRLPFGQRIVLTCMVTTAALPLGALFIPLWIYGRRDLWPGFEKNRLRLLG